MLPSGIRIQLFIKYNVHCFCCLLQPVLTVTSFAYSSKLKKNNINKMLHKVWGSCAKHWILHNNVLHSGITEQILLYLWFSMSIFFASFSLFLKGFNKYKLMGRFGRSFSVEINIGREADQSLYTTAIYLCLKFGIYFYNNANHLVQLASN